MHRTIAALVAVLLFQACGSPASTSTPPPPPEPALAQVDVDDPTSCAPCHAAVVGEWTQSMHARAHHDADPIYGAMRTFRMGKEGDQLATACNNCHTPRAPDAEDSPAAKAGVSCATCHTTAALTEGKSGAAALVAAADGALHGPHDLAPGASPVHGTGAASAVLTDGVTMCMACHQATKNAQGVAACTTGPEHDALPDGATCTSCHMPRVAGSSGSVSTRADHASHAFLGPHRAWLQDDPSFLAQAVAVDATFDTKGLTLSLRNTAGHAVPTGFPGRMAMVQVLGSDAAGAVVWRSFTDDPVTQSPEAVWRKVYVDAQGKPAMPPYAHALAADTRLQPGATAALSFTPPAEVVSVEVRLVMRLLAPPAAAALGIADAPEAQPRAVVLATVARSP